MSLFECVGEWSWLTDTADSDSQTEVQQGRQVEQTSEAREGDAVVSMTSMCGWKP